MSTSANIGALRNQFRKELLQYRGATYIFVAFFAIELVDALLVSSRPYSESGALEAGRSMSKLVPLILVFAAAALTMKIGFDDSPTNSEAYVHTRPVPARAIWCAKALFVGLFILLPIVLVPFIVS